MQNRPKLTLAFSTMGARVDALEKLLSRLCHVEHCEFIVIVQKWQEENKEIAKGFTGVTFIWSDEIGLSRSRNTAIEHATGEFLWSLDDDVDISEPDLRYLLTFLQNQAERDAAHIYRVRVGCLENPDHYYKNYSDADKIVKLNLLQMNSIELILSLPFVRRHNLKFNEKIGLGTAYPGNEEVNFLLDAYERGASFKLVHKALVFHSCLEGGRRKTESNEIMQIRGATASRFGLLGPLLLLRWGTRYALRDKSINVVKHLLKGYFNTYKHFR